LTGNGRAAFVASPRGDVRGGVRRNPTASRGRRRCPRRIARANL